MKKNENKRAFPLVSVFKRRDPAEMFIALMSIGLTVYTLLYLAIGNGRFCGGGFDAAPIALLDDGLMDVAIIKKISRLTFIGLVGSYKKGTYLSNEKAMQYITYKRVEHFKMEFDEPIPICIDGEIKGAKNIDFSVAKRSLNFVIPKGCDIKYKSHSQD